MSDTIKVKPPIWFWIVAVLFVIWNLFGCYNYILAATATPEGLAKQGYTAEQVQFLLDVPALYLSVFALAVWTGLAAAILLLLRRSFAVTVYLISLVFVILSFIFDFVGGTFDVLGTAYLGIMSFVLIMAIVEFFVARLFRSKAWLT